MNGRQRARWYADQVSDLERLQKQARGRPDSDDLAQAISRLRDAREKALSDDDQEGGAKY